MGRYSSINTIFENSRRREGGLGEGAVGKKQGVNRRQGGQEV